MKKLIVAAIAASLLVIAGVSFAQTGSSPGSVLDAALGALQAQLDDHEARIAALEEGTPPPPQEGVAILEPAEGATLTGVVTIRVRVPEGTDWLGVYSGFCPGNSIGEDHAPDAPGEFSVVWDTASCSNGQVNVDAWAFDDDGSNYGNHAITVTLENEPPPPPPPAECEPGAEPAPISGQGYTERFSDCFNTLDRTTWCDRQWWESAPVVGSQTVANGELRLRRAQADGYSNTTMTTEPCGQANPRSFQGGYFEARMRYETVQGNGPAFWLFSTAHAENGDGTPPDNWPNPACPGPECLSAELDVFEGFGRIQYGGTREDDFFSGTLHRNSCECYGQGNQSRFVQRGTGLDLSEWHTYGALWTDSAVSYYIDGQLQGSVATFDSTAQPMHLLLYNWNTPWETENMPGAGTEPELDVFVDWVRVWQADPEPPAEPDIEATENWTCTGAVNYDLVRVSPQSGQADAVNLRQDCSGRIGRLEVAGRFQDCIKVNPPVPATHDLVIESGYCHATEPPLAGVHQDCIQAGGGENVLIRNFVFDCIGGGGGNYFIASFNGGTPSNFVCDHCAFGPRHPNQIRTPSDPNSGVSNSLVCQSLSGRETYSPTSGDRGGNFSPPASDPQCEFAGLLAYAES